MARRTGLHRSRDAYLSCRAHTLEPHLCVFVVEWGAWIDHHVRSRVFGVSPRAPRVTKPLKSDFEVPPISSLFLGLGVVPPRPSPVI
eukprot:scaffold11941_cov45-Phaeocystis_antarctica.AAC.1